MAQTNNTQVNTNEGKKIEIKVPEQVLVGNYANFAIISHNETEFIMDMARIVPGTSQAHVVSRVVMHPKSIKGLYNVLGENIRNYESKFGEIEIVQRGIPKSTLN